MDFGPDGKSIGVMYGMRAEDDNEFSLMLSQLQ